MRLDFDLDIFTVGLLVGNLHRIEILEQDVGALKARMRAELH
jgi:hypothetical protein